MDARRPARRFPTNAGQVLSNLDCQAVFAQNFIFWRMLLEFSTGSTDDNVSLPDPHFYVSEKNQKPLLSAVQLAISASTELPDV